MDKNSTEKAPKQALRWKIGDWIRFEFHRKDEKGTIMGNEWAVALTDK